MALLNVIVKRSQEQVWDFLSDGSRYAEWVVGTREIRDVDEGWPAVGTNIYFTVGRGPMALSDRTTVRNAEPPRMLEMEVHAGRLGTARLLFEIRKWGEHAVVVLDEHPLSGPGAHLHNLFVDVALRFRNRRMLDKLARLIEQEYDAPAPVDVGASR